MLFRSSIIFIIIAVTLASCEGELDGHGKIISAQNNALLDSAKINFSGYSIYSDKKGSFEINVPVGCPLGCPELEVIVSKKGYETKYLNLSDSENREVTIRLAPTHKNQYKWKSLQLMEVLYYTSITTVVIAFLSFIFIILSNTRNKTLWGLLVIFGTLSFQYNYISEKISVSFLRPSIMPYFDAINPIWYKFNLPVGILVFWVLFIFQSRKKSSDLESKRA